MELLKVRIETFTEDKVKILIEALSGNETLPNAILHKPKWNYTASLREGTIWETLH